MATSTKNKTRSEADIKKARSDAAKKAAETRKKNALAKKQQEKQELAEAEQKKVQEEVSAQNPIKICDVICDTLQMIRPGTETNERPEGYTYKECLDMVLTKVRETKPDAQTSLDCLRWYATKLRSEGIVLPFRPRNAPTKKDVLA